MSCQDVCVEMDYDGCSTDFYREVTRRAAKEHRCAECRAVIVKGETHVYVAGKTDGEMWSARTCAPCAEIRATFCCGGWVLETLWEEIAAQMFGQWDEMKAIDCLARLKTQSAVDKMRAKYAEFAEDRP